ncbi:MAG TPA: hypothetical protein VE442_01980 [Jatrophihabitans sp.]|nr:hypothetical protein [Jatrophihabitans sp.]
MPKPAVLALACCLVAAGCTNSGSGTPSRSTVESVGLQLSDFPPSWQRVDESLPDVLGKLADCTGIDLSRAGDTQETVGSGVFRNGDRRIWSVTTGYRSQQGVADRAAAIGSSQADTCIATVLRPSLADVVPGARTVSSQFTAEPGGFNTAAAVVGTATGVVSVDSGGRRAKIRVDVSFIGGNELASVVVFVGVGKQVPRWIEQTLIFKIARRALAD